MNKKKETWKAITINGKKPSVPYAISNHGRFGVLLDGKVKVRELFPSLGTYRFNIRHNGKNKALFIAKEVAQAFLKKPSPKHKLVIHKDHDYLNDYVENLKWATMQEHRAHTMQSPRAVQSRKRKAITDSSRSKVLDEKSVITLKKMIWDPKRKLSFEQLAHKFGVSEMQIYRIKKGDFWYHIKVDNEPEHPKYKQNLSNIAYQEKLTERKKAQVKAASKRPARRRISRKTLIKAQVKG